ncbi:Uncharacterized protein TCM_006870 [Theobroma cacao]|uniref:Uncharacterized protein n=1 Tax=Theobroma cacao TaxID=3641 RepID=A0A061DYY6_THECC|nr:Uncharacterized protein TCM_006870 [Theobroma cacao]
MTKAIPALLKQRITTKGLKLKFDASDINMDKSGQECYTTVEVAALAGTTEGCLHLHCIYLFLESQEPQLSFIFKP